MVEVKGLTKEFRDWRWGRTRAVADVSFSVGQGEALGLLGPNGAGKTTVLRMISTALRPTGGTAVVDGHDVRHDPAAVRRRIGFLSTGTALYGRLTPRETLRFFGRLNGMTDGDLRRRIDLLAGLLDMGAFLDRPCDKLSHGMKQKANIARCLLHDPPVVVLDEPTTGLDVPGSRRIVDFIRQCREEGKTVLLSTHNMLEVERLCDRVAVLAGGRLVFFGDRADLHAEHGADLEDAFVSLVAGDASP